MGSSSASVQGIALLPVTGKLGSEELGRRGLNVASMEHLQGVLTVLEAWRVMGLLPLSFLGGKPYPYIQLKTIVKPFETLDASALHAEKKMVPTLVN